MSDRQLYALTGEDVSILKDALHGPLIGMTFTGGPRVPRIAHAANALTPLDRDAAVERMAEAIYDDGGGTHVWVGWAGESDNMKEQFRQAARAALASLHQEDA